MRRKRVVPMRTLFASPAYHSSLSAERFTSIITAAEAVCLVILKTRSSRYVKNVHIHVQLDRLSRKIVEIAQIAKVAIIPYPTMRPTYRNVHGNVTLGLLWTTVSVRLEAAAIYVPFDR